MLLRWVPGDWSIPTNYLIELRFHQEHGVGNIIANFMELCCWEVMFAGPVHKGELWGSFFEKWPDVFGFLSNWTVKLNWEVGGWESGGCDGLASEFFIKVVKFSNLFEGNLNLSTDFIELFFLEWSFKIFILFPENLWKYLIHVNSWDFVKLSLVYHEDKVVHFLSVSEVSRPDFELGMFILNLFDESGKEQLHFVLHGGELWYFGVGIFVENVFDFAPFHFFTGLVEKRTFLSILEAIFADETWLTTLWIHTDHEAGVSIYAFRAVFEVFARHQYSVFSFLYLVNKYYIICTN